MTGKLITLFIALATASLLGCSGTRPEHDSLAVVSSVDSVAGLSRAPSGRFYTDLAGWEAWLDNPGTPGVDYDPGKITVSFMPDARLPKGVSAAAPDAGARAEDQPNALVRINADYEILTNAIAARYDLAIGQQVYWQGVNVAGFLIPDGVDGDTLLRSIRTDFAGTVEYAGYSQLYEMMDFVPNDPDYLTSSSRQYGPLWTLHRIGCSAAWNLTTGSKWVKVAVADTGVRVTHEELALRVLDPATEMPDLPPGTYLDVVNNDNTMEDLVHHGTVIAGQIAAQGQNSRTIIGAAHGCEIIPVKISEAGLASDTDIITGCTLAVQLGAQVVNLSFGDSHTNPSMEQMVNDIWNAGAVFVAASGNENTTSLTYPADYDNSISVGATDIDDARVDFSNYGPGVDIAAPGVGIKSTWHTSDTAYSDWTTTGGTSFACPLVAAGAALLWSYNPGLSNVEVRNLLLSTVAPTSGFTSGEVGRLDIAAALADVTPLSIELPEPTQLIHHGNLEIIPVLGGTPEVLECYVGGVLTQTLTEGPWVFTVDTTCITFGTLDVEVTATLGQIDASASIAILVDNSAGVFPLTTDFEDADEAFKTIDVRLHSEVLLKQIKAIPGPGEFWTTDEVAAAGAGRWFPEISDVFEGTHGAYCGAADRSYDIHEIDAMVSRRIDLTGELAPTLVFHHHYNTSDGANQDDLVTVYVSNDNGRTFTTASLRDTRAATFSGNSPDWTTVEVDLSSFTNQIIHIVFVLETDKYSGGATAPLGDLGWWVDKIAIGHDYLESFPSFSGVSVAPGTVIGRVPGTENLPVQVENPQDLQSVNFHFDFAPIGVDDPYDIMVRDTAAPFDTTLIVPTDMTNRELVLAVTTIDLDGGEGPSQLIPLYLFNLAGDTNLDGTVDQDDVAAIEALLGSTTDDPGYTIFIDANQDGMIDERDAALVGYHFGEGI